MASKEIEHKISPTPKNKLKDALDTASKFISVSPQLHTLSGLFATTDSIFIKGTLSNGDYGRSIILGGMLIAFVTLQESKAIQNLRNYRRIKRMFGNYGWDKRIAEPMTHTWCDLYSTRKAAIDSGYKHEISSYYKSINRSWFKLTQK